MDIIESYTPSIVLCIRVFHDNLIQTTFYIMVTTERTQCSIYRKITFRQRLMHRIIIKYILPDLSLISQNLNSRDAPLLFPVLDWVVY